MITHPILERLSQSSIRLGLERIGQFLSFIGDPHRKYPVVHVAGTNGKGSVCAVVTRALVVEGYRVGTTISPHIEALNERVQIDGRPVDDATLNEAIESIDRARRDFGQSIGVPEPLTYFEFMIAVAFLVFAERGVQLAVVEVGLGGRLDATNVVEPVVTAITSIGLDHQDRLGDTHAQIAAEKAGIIKRGAPVVVGPMRRSALEVIERVANLRGAEIWKPGTHLFREPRGDRWHLRTPDGLQAGVQLAMAGQHQGGNAMVALGVLHQLRRQGFALSDEAIREGLETGRIAGRLEQLLPGLFVDGAHNVDGTQALADFLSTRPRPPARVLLFGMGEGRDPQTILKPLVPHVDEVVLTRGAHPKARDPLALARELADLEVALSVGGPIERALPEVYREANETFVAGSLFLVGAARALVAAGALDGLEPGQGLRQDLREIQLD